MDYKEYLTNKSFCPIPWGGLMYNFNGDVKNCIRSSEPIGNIQNNTIHEILQGESNCTTKQQMLDGKPGTRCYPCYNLEKDKNSFDIISDRIFYIKELKTVDISTYDNINRFNLRTIDARWSNLCNFACVYCGSEFSSRWTHELGITHNVPNTEQMGKFKEYIFDNASQLIHVYLAGGEPLLMKENLELLKLLKKVNPLVNLRINTNLSKVDTSIFELICTFPNVHWIVSVDTIEEEFEYIRYGGKWDDFINNLLIIKSLNHKISFNMLHFLLNFESLFACIRYFQQMGFHANSFILGALIQPNCLDIRHLPSEPLLQVKQMIIEFLDEQNGYLLDNGLTNLISYIDTPMEKDISKCLEFLHALDKRRGLNSVKIFQKFYNTIQIKSTQGIN